MTVYNALVIQDVQPVGMAFIPDACMEIADTYDQLFVCKGGLSAGYCVADAHTDTHRAAGEVADAQMG